MENIPSKISNNSTYSDAENDALKHMHNSSPPKNPLVNDYLDADDYRDLSVMVVDDTTASLMTIVPILSDYGYAVRPVKDGTTAIEKAFDNPPDLVLLDVVMPQPDGFEVCKQLRADKRTAHIPVILFSGREDIGHKTQGFEVGAVDYITKPFDSQEVLIRVKHHISAGLLRRQLEQRNARLHHSVRQHIRNQEITYDIFQQLPYPMILFQETTGRVIATNSAFHDLLGYPLKEIGKAQSSERSLVNIQDMLVSAEQVRGFMQERYASEAQRYTFKHAHQQLLELDVQSHRFYLNTTLCTLVIFDEIAAQSESASTPKTATITEATEPQAITQPVRSVDAFMPLFNIITASYTTEDVLQHSLDFLVPALDAREGHVLFYDFDMQYNQQFRKTRNSPLRIVAQQHRYDGDMQLESGQVMDARHILSQLVHGYQKPLFCQLEVASLVSPDLQRFMHTLSALWLLLIPVRTLRAEPGAFLFFGDSTYAPMPKVLDTLEILRQQLAYRFDRNAKIVNIHSTIAS